MSSPIAVHDHERHLRALYAAISAGEDVLPFFHPDAEQIEYPSTLRPQGHRRGLAEMAAGAALGRTIIGEQHYDVHTVITRGDETAVQLTWTATLAAEVGALAAGTRLTAHVAGFYVFRDGLVLRQSSYDCYEPIGS